MPNRREYGSGSVYQRTSDQRWVGTIETGWNANGTRRRVSVTMKPSGQGEAAEKRDRARMRKKLDKKRRDIESGTGTTSGRATVRTWALEWLEQKRATLRPKAYRAAESPVGKWIIPTIGHKRLADLTPGDIRAVQKAQRDAGLKTATAAATHRVLLNMLRAAQVEGHTVPAPVLLVRAPKADPSDRRAMTVDEGLACIAQASELDHGTRWLMTLLYGLRQGESLGLTWDAIDWDAGPFGEFRIEWQLQALTYEHGCSDDPKKPTCGRKRAASCPQWQFQKPDGFECRHLVDAFHLVRPKSKSGFRVAPLLRPVRDALLDWQQKAPVNPWGLIWPTVDGRPPNVKHDEFEWEVLQETAGVRHPTRVDKEGKPRGYYVHECRNFAATMLLEADVPEHVVTDLLGHSTLVTSLRYRTKRREPLYEALERMGARLQLG